MVRSEKSYRNLGTSEVKWSLHADEQTLYQGSFQYKQSRKADEIQILSIRQKTADSVEKLPNITR